jgi:hypothetical protein
LYLGGTAGVEPGSRGSLDVGVVRTAGGLVGLRLSEKWSASEREFQGFLFSLKPAATEAERERFGAFGTSVHHVLAGRGYSAQVLWKFHESDRVDAAFSAGVSWRRFFQHHERVVTRLGPEAEIPPDHPELRVVDTTRYLTGGGYSAGVIVPIRIGGDVHLAPEAEFTFGGISGMDAFNIVFRSGARLLWRW